MTTPNTLSNHYLSVMQKTTACEADLKKIIRNCQPEPDSKQGKSKARKKSGLASTIKKSFEAIDKKAKTFTGYKRDKVKGRKEQRPFNSNAWIEDHCAGLWVSPYTPNEKTGSDLKELMDETSKKMKNTIDNLEDELDSIMGQLSATQELFDQMWSVAIDIGMGPVAERIAKKFAIKAGVKGVIGFVGAKTVFIPILMALWTIADVAVAINDLASHMGDKGKAFLKTFDNIANADEKLAEIAKDFKEKPMKGLTNAMKYAGDLNPCINARKC